MRGKKLYHLRVEYVELHYLHEGIKAYMETLGKDNIHARGELAKLRDELELIMRRV